MLHHSNNNGMMLLYSLESMLICTAKYRYAINLNDVLVALYARHESMTNTKKTQSKYTVVENKWHAHIALIVALNKHLEA